MAINHPRLNAAAQESISKHILCLRPTSRRISSIIGTNFTNGLDKIFLLIVVLLQRSDENGDQYQHASEKCNDKNLPLFVQGYHGDAWNAMSVCDPTTGCIIYHHSLPVIIFSQTQHFNESWND